MNVYKLLHTAQKNINYPKLRIVPFVENPKFVLMFTIAGERAAFPGSINITTDHELFDRRTFFGRILQSGEIAIQPSLTMNKVSVELISDINDNLEEYIRKTSYLTEKCALCNEKIQDSYSKLVGWGPECAKKWGLKWSELNPIEFNKKVQLMKNDITSVISNKYKYDPYVIYGKIKGSRGKSLDNLYDGLESKYIIDFINQCRIIEIWLSKLIKVVNSDDFSNFIYAQLRKYHNTDKFIILTETQKINELLEKWNLFKRAPNSLKKIYNPLFLGPLWNQYVIKTVNSGKIILDKKLMFTA